MEDPYARAQEGLNVLKLAIVNLLKVHPDGLRNSEITKLLGLQSDQMGKNKDYLSWSILGLLMMEDVIVKKDKKYLINLKER